MALKLYYQKRNLLVQLRITSDSDSQSAILNSYAKFYSYAIHNGRRIYSLERSCQSNAGSSIIKYIHLHNNIYSAGVVINIFKHRQGDLETLFAEVRWMKMIDQTPLTKDIWYLVSVLLLI